MKKLILTLFISLFIISCGVKDKEKVIEEVSTGNVTEEISNNSGETEEETKEDKRYKDYHIVEVKNRVNISFDDIDNIYIDGAEIDEEKLNKNPVLKNGKEFLDNLKENERIKVTEHINGGIEYSDYEESILKSQEKYLREMLLSIDIVDSKTGEKIKKGNVYVNNIKFGEFQDGLFEKEFKWPMGIEKYTIMIRTDGYGDGFLNLNSLKSDGSYLVGSVKLKKSIEKNIVLKNEDIIIGDFKKDNFTIEIPKCSLVDSEGKCFKGKVTVKSNYISGEDVNSKKTSLNMISINKKGKYSELYSGGMVFNDFITEEGEILKLKKGEKIKVIYKLSDLGFREFADVGTEAGIINKNGYWWYDKNNLIWREGEATSYLDRENKLFIIETEYLY